ncbi:hypothetical protein IAT38_006275 [Cryptococcus sp. DSM 104549]
MAAPLTAWLDMLQEGDGGDGGGGKAPDDGNGTIPLPPGSGPTRPWFSTQLTLSLAIGVTSFLLFCFLRTRWEIVYMGRTKLKDFSPTPAHGPDSQFTSSWTRFFGWIIPTLKTSEFTVLQTVGLDAAVLLNFFRMSFMLFAGSACFATLVLIPLNLYRHGSTDSGPDPPGNDSSLPSDYFYSPSQMFNATAPTQRRSFYDLLLDPSTSTSIHLIFTYLFTFFALYFFHQNFHRFVHSRQTFGLHLIHSISSRTVLVTNIPSHLRKDTALAEYFEKCEWKVESVNICREVEKLRRVLERRTNALLKLEEAWVDWVQNPAPQGKGYDPAVYSNGNGSSSTRSNGDERLVDIDGADTGSTTSLLSTATATPSYGATPNGSNAENSGNSAYATSHSHHLSTADPEAHPHAHIHVHTARERPTLRPRWFGAKVDAIDHWEKKFREEDENVKELRRKGRFDATQAAFVTFEDVRDAQTACQVAHNPHHSQVVTELAPEPRDVVWSKVSMSAREGMIRDLAIMGVMGVLLLFWIVPVSSLAALLSYNEIKKVMPWLARLIDNSPRLAALVQNSLPTLALIIFNGCLPFLLEWFSYMQGFRSRSATEYSLLKKYHLFLLISVLFIFLLTSTYLALVRDLVDTPMKIPEKLASALQGDNVRNFMVSYVMLQALGLMPLQLLNLGPLLSLGFARAFRTKTPRDYAEANAPPMLNYGWVYPPALLVFTITMVYSVMSPLILVFGAIYFGIAYLVFKYKLLFVYFKPYESNGEAWRITFARTLWALCIFQLFMTGLFSLRQFFWASGAMVPLIFLTLWQSWIMWRDFGPLSEFLAISNVCEVQRGEGVDSVMSVEGEGSVSRSQSNLNHRRYAMNDETLYVAPSDSRTDYSQPPMNNFYYGVLNTGRRRYAHPALSGSLPTPWLPALAAPGEVKKGRSTKGVVLSLRRKVARRLRGEGAESHGADGEADGGETPTQSQTGTAPSLPEGWATGDSLSRPSTGARATTSPAPAAGSTLSANPWGDPVLSRSQTASPLKKKISFDPASGIIALPEDNVWGDEDEQGDEPESPSTYFHNRDRSRTLSSSVHGGQASTEVGQSSMAPTLPQGGLAP